MSTGRITVLGRQDLNNWDGSNQKTFSRKSDLGGMDVLSKVGYEVDVLTVYGDGSDYTESAISKAVARIGTTVKRCLVLNPGTWVISSNLTITSNLTLKCPPGVDISVSSGVTLTIQGPIEAGPYQIFSGSGTVTISGVQIIHDQWLDATGNAYYPSTDDLVDLGKSTSEFKDGYFDGTVYADAISLAGAIIPEIDNTSDIGSSTYEFKDLYLDGKAYLDDCEITGTLDGEGSIQQMFIKILDTNLTVIHQFPIENIASSGTGFY